MIKKVSLTFCLLFYFLVSNAQKTHSLSSPSKALQAEIVLNNNSAFITLFDGSEKIIDIRTLQFTFDKDIIEGDLQVSGQERKVIDEIWEPLYGERNRIRDNYNELLLFVKSEVNRKEMSLKIRLYNEGLAFQYSFEKEDFWNRILTDEKTQFLFQDNCSTLVTNRAQGIYTETSLSAMRDEAERPQVICLNDHRFVAIGEAELVDFARMKLKKSDEGIGIQSSLAGKVSLDLARYCSPWRYVMVADHPGKLVENNYFVLNLNEACKIKNTDWIKPGKIIREVTLTTVGGLACVDFAAKHKIDYVEFDAGWYGPETDPESNASTITVDPARSKGPLDLHEVIRYANSKNIGIIVYVNMKALHKQLDQILPLYQKWGIKGVKYGFVDVGDQYSTAWLHHAVRLAAKYQLMVDIHDEYRPTGYSRTYPNLMTQEGIRGDEESPSMEQTLLTFYNRMICGAGDYTNCFFAERVTDKMSGRAAQLAKLVAIYSPWQFVFWYDRPENSPVRVGGAGSAESIIKMDPVTNFYSSIPTVWDDTHFLGGEMGKYAVIARRSGSNWYVSILNAEKKRQLSLSLDFLGDTNHYTATLYSQKGSKKDEVAVKNLKLKDLKNLSLEVTENNGCLLFLSKLK